MVKTKQGFGFEPDMDMDMDMDMFPRTRLGRMHDPFANFGTSTHFGFPQFGSLGRRRAADPHDDDFFNRLPSEFRQYIPEGFGHRRAGSGAAAAAQQPQSAGPGGQYFQYSSTPPSNGAPQSPTKKVCDAAIQTEDPTDRTDTVDCAAPQPTDNLKQHGLRNTVDMGIKSATESDGHGARSHSAPPNEQQQQQQPVNGKRQTPPPQAGQSQFGTQTSPHVQAGVGQQPQFQKAYYPPQQQSHPQQRQQTPPPPQTPGGTFVRTIPIFVEGRSEPIINSHKEIPMQSGAPSANASASASASASARAHAPNHQQHYQQPQPQYHHPQQHQHQHRPTPLNTQHQSQQQQRQPTGQAAAGEGEGVPPQTPHTLDSINKIQDIQRDVLDLMGRVEKFGGTRKDKQYVYLDEMLTRNLLKLDTIDTNGKESIRLARKEAIKCIQASINVLEAKAEENARLAQQAQQPQSAPESTEAATQKSASSEAMPPAEEGAATAEAAAAFAEPQPADATKIQQPIPLPPPEGMQVDESAPAEHEQQASGESQKELDISALAVTENTLQGATAESSTESK